MVKVPGYFPKDLTAYFVAPVLLIEEFVFLPAIALALLSLVKS